MLSPVGTRVNSQEEARRVTHYLNTLSESSAQAGASFWLDRTRGHVLALLQDRTREAGRFFERCRAALGLVYDTMFPLNPPVQGLAALMEKFRDGQAIKNFVRLQFTGGAETALAIVHAHHTGLNLEAIGQGPPTLPDGEPLEMAPYYNAVEDTTKKIALLVEAETELLRQEQEQRGER